MTVIAALAQGKKGVWMAADRQASFGDGCFRSRKKIIIRGSVMWGAAGTGALIHAAEKAEFDQFPPKRKIGQWVEEVFVPAIRKAMAPIGTAGDDWTTFLVGVHGRLFFIDSRFAVHEQKAFAIGSGGEMAIGALDASHSLPKDRVRNAVVVCCKRLTTCAGPIQVEHIR